MRCRAAPGRPLVELRPGGAAVGALEDAAHVLAVGELRARGEDQGVRRRGVERGVERCSGSTGRWRRRRSPRGRRTALRRLSTAFQVVPPSRRLVEAALAARGPEVAASPRPRPSSESLGCTTMRAIALRVLQADVRPGRRRRRWSDRRRCPSRSCCGRWPRRCRPRPLRIRGRDRDGADRRRRAPSRRSPEKVPPLSFVFMTPPVARPT